MEVKAYASSLPISAQKIRLVCDQVRGKEAQQALVILQFMPHKGAEFVGKVIASALANAENNFDLDKTGMFVKEIFANESFRLKRVKAGSRGRYKPRVKRYAHLTVILDEYETK